MKRLYLGSDFYLPVDVASDVVAIVGRRGRGKTTTAAVLVEEMDAAGVRFCVADPVGVWWGLKSKRDGKAAGIPVVVFGGEHADAPLEDTAGEVVADFVADPSSPSVVLDFRLMRKGQMTRFMAAFLERLYHKNREPLHLVLDEADKFAPQRVMGEEARLVGAAEDVVKMGRARGLGVTLITQRPATLNKNVLTQAGVLVAHGLPGPQDQKAVDDWIREHGDPERRAKFLSALPGLERGVAWVWAPELDVFRQVHVRDRFTFDSSSTPKAGERRITPKVLAPVDLEKLSEAIKATIARQKENDPRELRRRIVELERVSTKAPVTHEVIRKVEVHILKDEQVRRLEAAVGTLEKRADDLAREAREIKAALAAARDAQSKVGAGRGSEGRPAIGATRPAPVVPRTPRVNTNGNGDGRISGPQQVILDALAYFLSINVGTPSRRQVALVAKVSASSSGYEKNLSTLRTVGFIDYPGPNLLTLTRAGAGEARAPETPPTIDDLQDAICGRLSRPQADILRTLIGAYPKDPGREELASLVNQSETSSGFEKNLSTLRSLGLIHYPQRGTAAALPVLFLEGS